ncbi:MAG: amidohydrolase family protein [Gemmatimonadales bacterium]|nr:amidohydrolase family protein [Gemmatimonadales bacterium]
MVSLLRVAGVVTCVATIASPLSAQRNAPAAYAITNARLVPVSSPAIDQGTVVIRGGLIVAVGATVAVPADARVIDGTGLTVYPGLIDGFGTLGLPSATPAAGGGAAPPGGGGGRGGGGAAAPRAPNSTQAVGLQPELAVVNELGPDAASFTAARAAGFTTAFTSIGAGVFRGQSAVINLDGTDVSAMVVKSGMTQQLAFSRGGGGGGFPGSLFGVFAAIRQELLDAQRYREVTAAYARSPKGMVRPAYDPSMVALQPVLARQMPMVMLANTQREIERALDLAKEFNLRVIIAGGTEAWKVAGRLKAENVPVLLTVNFPRRTTTPAADADPDPLRVLRERVEAPKGPAVLEAAGVTYAFTSGGAFPEFLANVRRAVGGGLTTEQALKAMTTTPAQLFGIADRMGALEAGRIANLTITKGDLFALGSTVQQLFIDGQPIAIPVTAPTAGAGAGGGRGARPGTLDGQWTARIAFDGAEREVTFTLTQDGASLGGVLEGTFGSAVLEEGSIAADGTFRFAAWLMHHDGLERAQFRGTRRGDALVGEVAVQGHGTSRFTGSQER